MIDDCPNWLKSMQNGSIGEIRTKAFLLDRFWILERSVDIHGADFIIQRRLYDKNILETEPSRFGVIQAKFSQNENTYHYINKEYVLDNENNPRKEFFLIINTGNEEAHKMFLLSADDIFRDFHLDKNDDKFIIPSKKVFSSMYEIQNRKHSLDRIENSIKCAEFYKNRSFLFTKLPYVKANIDVILPEYSIDIAQFEDISSSFKRQKEIVFETILQIEEIYEYLKRFVESIDPIEASCIAEEIECKFGKNIKLPEIFDDGFYYNSKHHKEMVDNMRNDGNLDNYILMRKYIIKEIESFFSNYLPKDISINDIHEIKVNYNPINFKIESIKNSIKSISEEELYKEFSKFIKAEEGSIIFSWKVGITYNNCGCLKMNDCCLIDIMEKIYELKFYKDCEV